MDSFVKSLLEMDARWPDLAGQRTDAPTDLESVAAFETLLDGKQLERTSVDQLIALVEPVVFSSCYLLRKCMPPGLRLFRARITPDRPESASDVSYPPASTVTKLGRFNRVGESRFYASLARPAAALEVRPRQGDWIALSVWEVTSSIWLDWFGYSGEVLNKMDSGHHLRRADSELSEFEGFLRRYPAAFLVHNLMARVFARDSGADAFKATIALSECIFALYKKQEQKNEAAALTQSLDVGGIMYPTVNSAGNGDNVALLPACADRGLALRQVQWGKVLNRPEGLKFDFGIADVSAGLHKDGRIEWIGKETLATLPLDMRRGLIMDRS